MTSRTYAPGLLVTALFGLLPCLASPQSATDADARTGSKPLANRPLPALITAKDQTGSASTVGLAGYWPMDEMSGVTAHDASGNGTDGTLECSGCTPLPAWGAGERNGGLNFSNPGDVVSIPDNPNLRLTSQFTISFWLNKSAGATNIVYLSKRDSGGYHIATGSPGNYIYVNLYNNGNESARCSATPLAPDQTWQHIALTDDGTTLTFYLNGAPVSTCSGGAPGTSSAPLLIGGANQSSPTGAMDELRIYTRALSAQEITAVYNDPGEAIAINPVSAVLQSGQTQQFSAMGAASINASVTWSISPQVGTISPTGGYTAPISVASAQTVTVTATGLGATGTSGVSTISLITGAPPVTITMSPPSVTLTAGQATQFSATVNGSANTGVSWSISPQIGTISAAGLYTAPGSIPSAQTIVVTATSLADNTKSTTAIVSLPAIQTLTTLSTFSLAEQFGVAWPDQIIEFRYDGGQPAGNTRMIGPLGVEVPFQWVSSCSDTSALNGCIAVRSSLPANASYTWTLQSGVAPAAPAVHPVQLSQVGSNYVISNGLTGVRVVTAAGNPSPWNQAPIQGILLPNGTWTGAGASPNRLYAESKATAGCMGCSLLQTAMYTATAYNVTVVDSGPMKVVLKAAYTFNRPQYTYGNTILNAAGQGHYTALITLYANSKSVLIDEDSDMMFSYYLPVYAQLLPNQARVKGHDAVDSSGLPNPVCGYETPLTVTRALSATPIVIAAANSLANGQRIYISGVQGIAAANGTWYAKTSGYPAGEFALYSDSGLTQPVAGTGAYGGGGIVKPAYRGQNITPASDAYLDLTYGADRPASYRCDANSYRKLLSDYPAATHSSGWYTELYNSAAGTAGPVVGMYTGRASQQVFSAAGPSMPGLYSSNKHWISGTQDAGIQIDNLLRGPDGTVTTVVHRNWALFVSTEADLLTPSAHQPIANEQNGLTGINLSRLYTYTLQYADPPGGWNWLYLSQAGANQLIGDVQNGTAICGNPTCYFTLLKNSEGSSWGSSLLEMWQGNSSAAVQTALNSVNTIAHNIITTLAAGDNHFDGTLGYYQIGLYTSPSTAVLNAILMNANATAAQKSMAKAELALFGSILWDDDWFPIDNNTGESDGLTNQIQQYLEDRTQSATADPSQPFLATKLSIAATYPAQDLANYFSPTGAAAGSTHYQSAFFEPLILNYTNPVTAAGLLSLTDPRWAAYANWELSIQTPPEPRFGNLRKGYSNGDGNTEADVRPGMLGTALNAVNPTLAGNLMWAWRQSNSASTITEDAQFVTTLAVIDPSIPSVTPQLGSINIPGYHAAERHNFGTPNETALWFIDGGFYSEGGHRHSDDGQVSIYALSAPLAIDWNANLYSPETGGRFMHNSIVYDTELPHAWNADNAGLSDVSNLMQSPTNTEFEAFGASTTATGTFTDFDGTVWTRSVRTMAFDAAYPVIYVKDTFVGPSAGVGKTLTWNLMATGPVTTPSGPVTPVTRLSAGCQSPAGQLPSDGNVYGLNAGLQRFTFTGAAWPKHPAGGINWDLFLIPTGGTEQFFIGNWGHGCHSGREMGEYQTANGAPFAETQHILRVHDTAPLTTILMPYAKTAPPVRTVTQQACGVQIQQTIAPLGSETTCFSDSAAQYTNGTTSILTVYDSSTQAAFGVSATGGPQEVTVQPAQVTWTISGIEAGTRSLTLPGNWSPSQAVGQIGAAYTYTFPGGAQTAPVTIVFTLSN